MRQVRINDQWDIFLPDHRVDIWKGVWEKKRLQSMNRYLGRNDTLFYIGAEEGDMPALCQTWGAKVVLFEPGERVWANIKAIWEKNKLEPPVMSFRGFASNIDKEHRKGISLGGFPKCADGEIVEDHGFRELRSANEDPQIKIDSVDATPTVLVIDVEGSEWKVLRGAEETLKKHKPKIWLSLHPEFMYEQYKKYAFNLRGWIKSFGYEEIFLEYDHEVHLLYLPK